MAPEGNVGSMWASGLPTLVTTVHLTNSEALAKAAGCLGAAHLLFLTTALSMQGAIMGYVLTRDA